MNASHLQFKSRLAKTTVLAGLALLAVDLLNGPTDASFFSRKSEEAHVQKQLAKRMPSLITRDQETLSKLLVEEAHAHGLPSSVLLSLIQAESGFRPRIISHRMAFGLMQVRYPTALEIAKKYKLLGFETREQLLDPHWNIRIGVRYLADLRTRFGNIEHALGAYNLGPAKYSRNIASFKPQPTDVRNYVKNILTKQGQFHPAVDQEPFSQVCPKGSSCRAAL